MAGGGDAQGGEGGCTCILCIPLGTPLIPRIRIHNTVFFLKSIIAPPPYSINICGSTGIKYQQCTSKLDIVQRMAAFSLGA